MPASSLVLVQPGLYVAFPDTEIHGWSHQIPVALRPLLNRCSPDTLLTICTPDEVDWVLPATIGGMDDKEMEARSWGLAPER